MKKLRALLVDDELLCRQDLRDALQSFPEIEVTGEANSLRQAKTLLRTQRPHLVFLDLSLGMEKGFDLLRPRSFAGAVIAVTAHPEHALTGFDLDLTDYLLKPVQTARLDQAIRRARQKLLRPKAEPPEPRLSADFSGQKKFVLLSEISRLEAFGNYVQLFTPQGRGLLRSSLKKAVLLFPKNSLLATSRNCWIKYSQIMGWSRKSTAGLQLNLADQSSLPVSRRHTPAVLKALTKP